MPFALSMYTYILCTHHALTDTTCTRTSIYLTLLRSSSLPLSPSQQVPCSPLSPEDGVGQLVPHAVPGGRGGRGPRTGLVLEVSLILHG